MAESSGLGIERLLIHDREEPMRTVRVAKLEELKPAVEAHAAPRSRQKLTSFKEINWKNMKKTWRNWRNFLTFEGKMAWKDEENDRKCLFWGLRRLDFEALKWDDRLADACGCEGIVLKDDESDGTAQASQTFDSFYVLKYWSNLINIQRNWSYLRKKKRSLNV